MKQNWILSKDLLNMDLKYKVNIKINVIREQIKYTQARLRISLREGHI